MRYLLEDIHRDLNVFSVNIVVTYIRSLYSLECSETNMESDVLFWIWYFFYEFSGKMERGCWGSNGSICFCKTCLIINFLFFTIGNIRRKRKGSICFQKIRNISALYPKYSPTFCDLNHFYSAFMNLENCSNFESISWTNEGRKSIFRDARKIEYFTMYKNSSAFIRFYVWNVFEYNPRSYNPGIIEKYNPVITKIIIQIPESCLTAEFSRDTINYHHPSVMMRTNSLLSYELFREIVGIIRE